MGVGKSLAGVAIGLGGYWLFRMTFDVPFEMVVAGLLATVFAFAIGSVIGYPVGYFLSRNGDVDGTAYRVFALTNLLAWIIPVLGATLAAITYMMSRQSDDRRILYYALSTIGGLLAMGNAAWGGATAQAEAKRLAQAVEVFGVDPNALRSTERCPYAAREAWSAAEIAQYCRQATARN